MEQLARGEQENTSLAFKEDGSERACFLCPAGKAFIYTTQHVAARRIDASSFLNTPSRERLLLLRQVRFEPDGTFDAPTGSCQQRQCKWSADAEQVYIQWGSDGVHTVKPTNAKLGAKEGNGLAGKREDGEKCSASFIRKVVNDEDMDYYEVLAVDEVTLH
jgi:hypothetical protein